LIALVLPQHFALLLHARFDFCDAWHSDARSAAKTSARCDARNRRRLRKGVSPRQPTRALSSCLVTTRRKTMSKTSKLVLIVAIAAGIASPALAQSRQYGRDALGRNAYGMVPPNSAYADPSLTGGGSAGYNATIPQKTD
jgi:hypothetical protein